MNPECHVEQDLLDAVVSGRWPDRAEPSLRAHVDVCATCADVAVVAAALLVERDVAWDEAHVPPATLVWWRSQIRAREEAARLALRPIVLVQTAALVSVVVALFAWAPEASAWIREAVAGPVAAVAAGAHLSRAIDWSWIPAAAANATGPIVVLAIWFLIAPFVVFYLANGD